MRKMFFGLLATVFCCAYSFGQTFEESVALIPSSDVINKKREVAQSIQLKSFTGYKLLQRYSFNGVDFTDDGKYNDVSAGDGIYTSAYSAAKPEWTTPKNAFVGDKFTQTTSLTKWMETNKQGWGLTIHCKTRMVYTGTSWLGFSCASGCIELYDCDVTFTIGGGDNRTR